MDHFFYASSQNFYLRCGSDTTVKTLWEEYSELADKGAQEAWMSSYKAPKSGAMISLKDIEDALTSRRRTTPPDREAREGRAIGSGGSGGLRRRIGRNASPSDRGSREDIAL